MARSIFLTEPLDVLVVSSGGVGTTFLMKAIGQHLRVNDPDNKDGLKHLPIPPIPRGVTPRVIYVYGDPVMACLSLFRRKYHHTQSKITQHFYPPEYIVSFEDTLEDYSVQPREGFFFQRHFENWRDTPTAYPVLFMRYASIHDELPRLASYLELGEDFVAGFPPRRERKSSLEELPPATQEKLQQRYGPWQRAQADLRDAWVKPPTSSGWHFSAPYRRAYYEAARRQVPALVNFVKKRRQ